MNINDAMNLLGLSGTNTQKEISSAYKKASLKYHPDRNPAGLQMMQAINAAYDFLKSLKDDVSMDSDALSYDYAEELNEVLNKLLVLAGISIEVCGNWIWITGETKQHSKVLGRGEDGIGCFYAGKKKAWYYRPAEWKSKNRSNYSMDEIRDKYGSVNVKQGSFNNRLTA